VADERIPVGLSPARRRRQRRDDTRLVDLWLEAHRNPAVVARLRPLSPTLFATMRERICVTLREFGLISASEPSTERRRRSTDI